MTLVTRFPIPFDFAQGRQVGNEVRELFDKPSQEWYLIKESVTFVTL